MTDAITVGWHPDGAPTLERDGFVATITLRRPSSHNRIESGDLSVLRQYFSTLNKDRQVRAIVITSLGQSFSSGFDLTKLGEVASSVAQSSQDENPFERLCDEIENARAITIARLHGSIYGGSTDLALACDFRIGAKGIKMRMPAARLGVHYYGHGIRRWVTRLGLGASKKLFLTSRTIDADEMLRIGFLDALVEPSQLDAEVASWLGDLLATAPIPLVSMKSVLNEVARQQYDDKSAALLHLASLKTKDLREAVSAFAEKRAPKFEGM